MAVPQSQRALHSLEKIVAASALVAVLFLAVGFAQAGDKLPSLKSSAAFVQDAGSGTAIVDKNAEAPMPIASITKLMMAMVLLDASLDMDQRIAISTDDIDQVKGSRSKLRTGSMLKRDELLLIALMASENRAAAALGRTYPGGSPAFVSAMNVKAQALGMTNSRFVDATGLSPENVASAQDLARMVGAAHGYARIRDYSTRSSATVEAFGRTLAYRNTNGLVRSPKWDISVSKTGFISEAGRCLVMQVRVGARDLIVVLLDSWGKYSRIGDANRIRKWLESSAARGLRG